MADVDPEQLAERSAELAAATWRVRTPTGEGARGQRIDLRCGDQHG